MQFDDIRLRFRPLRTGSPYTRRDFLPLYRAIDQRVRVANPAAIGGLLFSEKAYDSTKSTL